MNILVTGGAGFIGSHVVDAYIEAGYRVVVVDDLSSGTRENLNPKAKFYHLDIRSDQVEGIFQRERFDVVNHHAAQMDVRRSVADPEFDASVNLRTLVICHLLATLVNRKLSRIQTVDSQPQSS